MILKIKVTFRLISRKQNRNANWYFYCVKLTARAIMQSCSNGTRADVTARLSVTINFRALELARKLSRRGAMAGILITHPYSEYQCRLV